MHVQVDDDFVHSNPQVKDVTMGGTGQNKYTDSMDIKVQHGFFNGFSM
ncbi:MAG: hypothetical protein OHK003_32870 [Anaerolineales bacterium]